MSKDIAPSLQRAREDPARTVARLRIPRISGISQLFLFDRPPGFADDEVTSALDARGIPQHAESELAGKVAAYARRKHPVHLAVVARVAAGHPEAHQETSGPARRGKDGRCLRIRLERRLTVDHLSDPDVLPFRLAATDLDRAAADVERTDRIRLHLELERRGHARRRVEHADPR